MQPGFGAVYNKNTALLKITDDTHRGYVNGFVTALVKLSNTSFNWELNSVKNSPIQMDLNSVKSQAIIFFSDGNIV